MTVTAASSVRAALVGFGPWGQNLARNLHALGALAFVCDPDPASAGKVAQQYPDAGYASRPEDVPRDLAVVIAAPAAQHAALCRLYLERGQHVFVEKPLALDVADAEGVVQLARQRGLVLQVGHLLHHHPAIDALDQLIARGALGRLLYAYSNRLNLGRFRREENSLWSFAPHDIAVLVRLFGGLPQRVQATGGYFLHPRVADSTVTHLQWASGVQAHIYVSWLHPFKEQRLVVVGQDAMAVFDDTLPWPNKLLLYKHGVDWQGGVPSPRKAEPEAVVLEQQEPLRREMQVFLQACADNTDVYANGEEGLQVLRVLAAAEQSLGQNGAAVELSANRAVAPANWTQRGVQVHPSAIVGDQAQIGKGSKIWHFAHVMDGARLGDDCSLGHSVFVQSGAVLGNRVRVQNHVSIYDGVVLEDDVFCGPSCVFTNVVRPRAHVSRRHAFAQTRVGKGATIGANATIVCGNRLGPYSFVAAGSVVTSAVPAHALVMGSPARVTGWVCSCGEKLGWPARPDPGSSAHCEACGERFVMTQDGAAAQEATP